MNSSLALLQAVSKLVNEFNLPICLRFSNNSGGIGELNHNIDVMSKKLNVKSDNIILMLDLGFIDVQNNNLITEYISYSLKSLNLSLHELKDILIASGSFPKDLSNYSAAKSQHTLKRIEWSLWEAVHNKFKDAVSYSDYGIKHPIFDEASSNYQGTISIKYSLEHEFVIYKGKLTDDHPDGHKQFITHAKKLIDSNFFMGADYSWGDNNIHRIGNQDIRNPNSKPGNATIWVAISQNHHIELINNLLF